MPAMRRCASAPNGLNPPGLDNHTIVGMYKSEGSLAESDVEPSAISTAPIPTQLFSHGVTCRRRNNRSSTAHILRLQNAMLRVRVQTAPHTSMSCQDSATPH